MKVHEFSKDLKKSHETSQDSLFETCYRTLFGDEFLAMHSHNNDGKHQQTGLDRSVILKSGKCLWIEEKVRDKDYPDILLEFYSNFGAKTPGWIEKPLNCDFIVYAKKPSRKMYIFPTVIIQMAWKKHKNEWIEKYGEKSAFNTTYRTVNCPVPEDVLFKAMYECSIIEWSEFDES